MGLKVGGGALPSEAINRRSNFTFFGAGHQEAGSLPQTRTGFRQNRVLRRQFHRIGRSRLEREQLVCAGARRVSSAEEDGSGAATRARIGVGGHPESVGGQMIGLQWNGRAAEMRSSRPGRAAPGPESVIYRDLRTGDGRPLPRTSRRAATLKRWFLFHLVTLPQAVCHSRQKLPHPKKVNLSSVSRRISVDTARTVTFR